MDIESIIANLKEYSQLKPGTTLTVAMKIILLNMAKYLDEDRAQSNTSLGDL